MVALPRALLKPAPYHDHVFLGTDLLTMRRHHCQGLRVPECPFWWQHSHKLIEIIKILEHFCPGCTKSVYAEISIQVIFGLYMVKYFAHALIIHFHSVCFFPLSQSIGNCALVLAAIIAWFSLWFKIQSVIWLVCADSCFALARFLRDNWSNVSPACGRMKTKQFIHLTWKISLTGYWRIKRIVFADT